MFTSINAPGGFESAFESDRRAVVVLSEKVEKANSGFGNDWPSQCKAIRQLSELSAVGAFLGEVMNGVGLTPDQCAEVVKILKATSEVLDEAAASAERVQWPLRVWLSRDIAAIRANADRLAEFIETMELSADPSFWKFVEAAIAEGSSLKA